MSEWYHGAILEMMGIQGFREDCQWIGRKLGVRAKEVRDAMKRLERLGLIRREKSAWYRFSIPRFFSGATRGSGYKKISWGDDGEGAANAGVYGAGGL